MGDVSKQVLVAIPCFNEEKTIGQLLFEIGRDYSQVETLVVDDGSFDDTRQIVKKSGSNLIVHPKNMGKGFSIKEAIEYAFKNNFKWIITLDGDGQHKPVHLLKFLKAIASDRFDVILGNRRERSRKMPFHRQLSNGITSIIVSLLGDGPRIHDSQCGFRAYNVQSFHNMPSHQQGFHFESEAIIWALRAGLRVTEIDIDTVYGNSKSSIHLVQDTIAFLRIVLQYLVRA